MTVERASDGEEGEATTSNPSVVMGGVLRSSSLIELSAAQLAVTPRVRRGAPAAGPTRDDDQACAGPDSNKEEYKAELCSKSGTFQAAASSSRSSFCSSSPYWPRRRASASARPPANSGTRDAGVGAGLASINFCTRRPIAAGE